MKHFYIVTSLLVLSGFSRAFAQAPVITSFTPTNGVTNTLVTINGSGFNAIPDSNVVYFGAIYATVTSASSNTISATVPTGATYNFLTVINKETRLSAKSRRAFGTSFSAGDLTFDPKVRLNPQSPAMNIKIADLDGDGKADILATAPHFNSLMVFHNQSEKGKIDTSSFTAPLKYTTGPQAGFVGVDDLNGDGKLDVILMNVGFTKTDTASNSLSFYRNEGKPGSIKLMPIAVSDKPDNYNFMLKPGDQSALIGDIDSDGKPDLIVLNKNGFITISRNIYVAGQATENFFGPGVTIEVGKSLGTFKLGDLDGDGKIDISITNNGDRSITTLLNNCSVGQIFQSSFSRTDFPLNFHPSAINLNDVDGDGKLDTVLDNPETHSICIIHNTSLPGVLSGSVVNITGLNISPDFYNNLITQDINGDSKLDPISLSANQDSIYFYPNKSEPSQINPNYFSDRVDIPILTIPDCITDLDGDGRPDMIVGSAFGIDIYHHKSEPDLPTDIPNYPTASPLAMMIFPNPASAMVNIKYNLSQKSEVFIKIYDSVGRLLLTSEEATQSPGDHLKIIDTSNLKNGVYVVKLIAGAYNNVGKLMIIK